MGVFSLTLQHTVGIERCAHPADIYLSLVEPCKPELQHHRRLDHFTFSPTSSLHTNAHLNTRIQCQFTPWFLSTWEAYLILNMHEDNDQTLKTASQGEIICHLHLRRFPVKKRTLKSYFKVVEIRHLLFFSTNHESHHKLATICVWVLASSLIFKLTYFIQA